MIYLLSPLKKEGTISLPMISFEIVANSIDFSKCDTLMFTSKQAVLVQRLLIKDGKLIHLLLLVELLEIRL